MLEKLNCSTIEILSALFKTHATKHVDYTSTEQTSLEVPYYLLIPVDD